MTPNPTRLDPADLQGEFSDSIRTSWGNIPEGVTVPDGVRLERRFNIYRNNHIVGLTESLRSTFPVVHQLVGDEFFQAAARGYVHRHPPSSPVLLCYGEQFGDFLDTLPGTASFPYLGDMARLEWCRVSAFHSGNALPVDIQMLQKYSEAELADIRMKLHPSVRLLDSRWPVYSIWRDCTSDRVERIVDMERAENLLILRPEDNVMTCCLDRASYVCLQSLASGSSIGEAVGLALEEKADTDLPALLALPFQCNAVVNVDSGQTRSSTHEAGTMK